MPLVIISLRADTQTHIHTLCRQDQFLETRSASHRPAHTWFNNDILICIILGKLPVDTRKNLARDHNNSEWSLHELQDAILKEIQVLETSTNRILQLPQPPFILILAETLTQPMILQIAERNINVCLLFWVSCPSICDVVTDQQ